MTASASSRSSGKSPTKKPAVEREPSADSTTRVIAIANQKGGVGKSTTAVSLGAALAENSHRVLVIDLDPQGNASTGLGIRHEAREVSVYHVLASDAAIERAVIPTAVEGLFAIPSTIDLAGAEIELVSQFSRELKLKKAIAPLRVAGSYDFVILDCPPSLGLLTVNALAAAEELIVPIQCEYYALEGLGQLLRNVGLVQQNINPDLRLSGIVMTMFDPRTKLSEQVVEEVQRYFGDLVYDVIIPRTVRLSEAPGFGQPITLYDPRSKGAECYRQLAREVAARRPPEGPVPTFDDLPVMVIPAVNDSPSPAPVQDEAIEEVPTVHHVIEEERKERAEAAGGTALEPGAATGTPEPERARRGDSKPADRPPPPPPGPRVSTPTTEPARPERTEPQVAELDEDLWGSEEAGPPLPPGSPKASEGKSLRRLPDQRVLVIDEDATEYVRPPEPRAAPAGPSAQPGIGATLEEEGKKARRWRLFRKGGE